MKHLLTLADLSKDELYELLDLADALKKEVKKGIYTKYLRNKALGMIFTKSSRPNVLICRRPINICSCLLFNSC